MYVGSKVHFQLQIAFPIGTTDLEVELFTTGQRYDCHAAV